MPSIALVGPGAIGCTLLAHLAQTDRHTITVAARTPFTVLKVDTPGGTIVRHPCVLTAPAAATARVDWILLATKTYDVEAALSWLDGLAGPSTQVAILQNGVEHLERLPARFPRARLVPVVVDCPAERSAPGQVRQRGPATVIVPDHDAGRRFVELFAGTPVLARTVPDWKTAAWRKLCINAAGAVSAATLRPAGIVHFAPVAEVMRGLVREVVLVGRAEGAQLDDSLVEEVIGNYQRAPRDALNSLHADRVAGRRMETDARNGVIARLGRKHGIPTPYNSTLAALLDATEQAD
jgi:2-dehydropantoate 2-reductase